MNEQPTPTIRDASAELRPASRADGPALQTLVASVLAEYGLASDPQTTDADLENPEASYGPRGGELWVLHEPHAPDQPIGCVGLWPLDASRVELRKMYLAPAARGRGLGKRLAHHAIDRARSLGYRRIELETATALVEAIGLYRSLGFQQLDPAGGHGCGLAARCDQAWALDLDHDHDQS